MGVSIDQHQYHYESLRMRMQIGVFFLGVPIKLLNVANVNPMAAGLAFQVFGRIVPLLEKNFSKPPAEIVKMAITGVIVCTSYSLAAQLDPRIQAICFLALLIQDMKTIGFQNTWKELKSER